MQSHNNNHTHTSVLCNVARETSVNLNLFLIGSCVFGYEPFLSIPITLTLREIHKTYTQNQFVAGRRH